MAHIAFDMAADPAATSHFPFASYNDKLAAWMQFALHAPAPTAIDPESPDPEGDVADFTAGYASAMVGATMRKAKDWQDRWCLVQDQQQSEAALLEELAAGQAVFPPIAAPQPPDALQNRDAVAAAASARTQAAATELKLLAGAGTDSVPKLLEICANWAAHSGLQEFSFDLRLAMDKLNDLLGLLEETPNPTDAQRAAVQAVKGGAA